MERALIVGLGNPGRPYTSNRHNVGFQIIDLFANRHGLSFSKLQHGAFVTSGIIQRRPVVLAKPQGYMNLSGIFVSALVQFYKTELEALLVVYDDLDLPVGTIRLRPDGRSGGQNGVRSIIDMMGTSDFPRVRVGIGRPHGKMDPAAYVLQDFGRNELEIIEAARIRAVDAIETWLEHGITLAMSRYNAPAANGETVEAIDD